MSSSAGTINADVNITINAEDNATVKVESAARKINRQWRELRIEQRAVQQSFELSNRKFVATGRVLNQVGSIVGRVQSAYNTYQLAQIRIQDATRNTADATRDLSAAIVEFGLNSPEAISAAEKRTDALENEKRAANDALIAYGLIAVTIVTLIGRVPALTGALKVLNKTLKSTPKSLGATAGLTSATGGAAGKVAGGGISGAIGKLGPKLLGGAAGLGIGAALGIVSDIQPAGEGELPGGFDAFGPLAGKIQSEGGKIVSTVVNVFANTSQEIVDQIQSGIESVTRDTGN